MRSRYKNWRGDHVSTTPWIESRPPKSPISKQERGVPPIVCPKLPLCPTCQATSTRTYSRTQTKSSRGEASCPRRNVPRASRSGAISAVRPMRPDDLRRPRQPNPTPIYIDHFLSLHPIYMMVISFLLALHVPVAVAGRTSFWLVSFFPSGFDLFFYLSCHCFVGSPSGCALRERWSGICHQSASVLRAGWVFLCVCVRVCSSARSCCFFRRVRVCGSCCSWFTHSPMKRLSSYIW